MKGIELSERFYREIGAPMIREQFPQLEPLVAVGLVGSGSECFGYDDELSQDHDFEPAFCLFLPGEEVVDRKTAFALERAYAKLPKEFMGYTRSPLSPVGGNRHGVLRIDEFFESKIGVADGNLSLKDWFLADEQLLAEAINGIVFRDDLGLFTSIRQEIGYFPETVRRKKLAGHLLTMGQAGQYNFARLVKRQDTAAAQLAVCEFVKSAIHAAFLLNYTYLPYYKWQFHALRALPLLADLADPLAYLLTTGCVEDKNSVIEQVAAAVIEQVREQGLTAFCQDELEGHAYAVNNGIEDVNIRNLHVLYAV